MKALPASDQSLLVRTDFSNYEAWESARDAVQTLPSQIGDFLNVLAMVNGPATGAADDGPPTCVVVDDEEYAAATEDDLLTAATANNCAVLFVFDTVAARHPEQAILVIDLQGKSGESFRCLPSQTHMIESNLSISNCDWEDFAHCTDADGVYRGDIA